MRYGIFLEIENYDSSERWKLQEIIVKFPVDEEGDTKFLMVLPFT